MGAPTISGGMTYEEQQKLLEEQAIKDEEAWNKRREQTKLDEAEREAADQAKKDAEKAAELARIAEVNMAEEESIKESMAMEEEEQQKPSKMKVDFYKSLYSGVGKNTQQNTNTRPL